MSMSSVFINKWNSCFIELDCEKNFFEKMPENNKNLESKLQKPTTVSC